MKIQKHSAPFMLIVSAFVISVSLPVGIVSAQGASDRGAQAQQQREEVQERKQEVKTRVEERKAEIIQRVEQKREEVKAKLDQKRLEICEKRAEKINQIVNRSTANSERHLEVFKKIADRTQAFYTDRELTAENYEQLVATVTEKETAATAAIEAAREVSFDCQSQDANNVGATVKDLMKSQHAALKEYRTAIKDLIVGVKQTAKQAEDTEGAGSTETTEGSGQEQTTTNGTTQE